MKGGLHPGTACEADSLTYGCQRPMILVCFPVWPIPETAMHVGTMWLPIGCLAVYARRDTITPTGGGYTKTEQT